MKEIGSEFWTNCTPHTKGSEYSMRPKSIYDNHSYQIVETLSGRTALEHIVELLVRKGAKSAYLPAYCCHTMIEPFLTHGMKVSFYDLELTENGLHRWVDDNHQCDCILVMDYFGHIDKETFEIAFQEKAKGVSTIYDATHSMYSDVNYNAYDFIYGSYRKWVDINCGFLAWKRDLEVSSITQNSSNGDAYPSTRALLFDKKASFMNGDAVSKDEFLPLVNSAESILEEQYHHKRPDTRSMEVLRETDADFLINARKQNAQLLTNAINALDDKRIRCFNPIIDDRDTPLFVAIAVSLNDRDALRKHLIANQIYCPVHWPFSDIHPNHSKSQPLFDTELSLICDQRYELDDMQRMINAIKEFFQ